ncbi:MAG: cytochrome P450, partial [Planctomycetaceae bacterium]|nr:cytochrome P450 [Planctomycetaceae bacterium]
MSDAFTARRPSFGAPVTHGSLLRFAEDPIACMKQLHQRHGDVAVMEQDDRRLVFVFSPELNRQVLASPSMFLSMFFSVRGGRRSSQRRLTSGLLSQNGTEHRDTRRVLKETFGKRVLQEYHPTICRLTQGLMENWEPGQQHDLNHEMVQFMLGMTSALLFGLEDQTFAAELGLLIDRWAHRNHEVGMGALVSSPEFTDSYDELLSQADELECKIHELFRRHQDAFHNGPTAELHPGERRSSVLSLLFEAQRNGAPISSDQMVGHATLLFAAAHLTTAHTFSWTLFLLAQHPQVMAAVRDEIRRNVAGDIPTHEEQESLTLLTQVIQESMRVLPASSYSQRVAAEPVTLGGVRLSPWTPVVFSQYITHHREDLFPAADQFRPERWKTATPSPYEYLPFGAGPRMCIGAPLAMVELRTALCLILKRFHFQIEAESTVDGHVVSTMLGPTSPIRAKLLPVDQLP